MKITDKYVLFWKTEDVFSQWHPSKFTLYGVTFNTAEQYMMYSKAITFGDAEAAAKALKTSDPREQKKIGRSVRNFDAAKWREVAKQIVYAGNKAKFEQNEEMLAQLLNTGDRELVEASPYDNIWGIGLDESDPDALDKSKWDGTNWLGEVLTELREELKKRNAFTVWRPRKQVTLVYPESVFMKILGVYYISRMAISHDHAIINSMVRDDKTGISLDNAAKELTEYIRSNKLIEADAEIESVEFVTTSKENKNRISFDTKFVMKLKEA